MSNILTASEAANVLRCEATDALMLNLLVAVDAYIRTATGRDWTQDVTIEPLAKAAARILITQWHEDPGMLAGGQVALSGGLSACLTQLEARALYYYTFEGRDGAGSIALDAANEGDTVDSVIGRVGATGSQAAAFETVISSSGYIQQLSSVDLSDCWFTAKLVPPTEV